VIETMAAHWPAFAVAGVLALLVAVIGGVLTEIGPWYNSLRFPSWKPPNWLFGPVWTTIFTLCVISAGLAWAGSAGGQRNWLVALFALNAGFNILWNILFFKLRRPDWALVETAFLWLSVAALMLFIWPLSSTASLLLAPYLTWVTIAGCLNLAIVRLNAPFAGVAKLRST
jgi:tryptophan-rich sensory protein